MKKEKQKPKLVKLQNLYTGDIVFTDKYDTQPSVDGMTFIPVFSETNPQRIYLTNKRAFKVVTVIDK